MLKLVATRIYNDDRLYGYISDSDTIYWSRVLYLEVRQMQFEFDDVAIELNSLMDNTCRRWRASFQSYL